MILAFLCFLQLLTPTAQAAVTDFAIEVPEYGGGLDLELTWTPQPDAIGYLVLRADTEAGPWELVVESPLPGDTEDYTDQVTANPELASPRSRYLYRVASLSASSPTFPRRAKPVEDASDTDKAAREDAFDADIVTYTQAIVSSGDLTESVAGEPRGYWLNLNLGHILLFLMIVSVGVMMHVFTARARRGEPIFIRRISGIDAIEEGIGRATEMGRPILYVPGIDELQDIQTIASMLILGQIAEKVAEYQSDIIVSCCIPIVREVADEVVKAGFYQAGYPDAYTPANTRFISSEQFAFCAGTNGIILREKPATNIYFGRFFAESLILAETGFVNKSIQIAGTAEATQLPFFIAACDYTLIGEELFAVSAYLSRDPRLVSSLKASDWVKVFVVASLIIGTVLATFGYDFVVQLYTIGH
ncbi:MAG: hypothetical protein ACI8RZ_005053 [Myxococcota bacterium]|jgi:hypothetical protein